MYTVADCKCYKYISLGCQSTMDTLSEDRGNGGFSREMAVRRILALLTPSFQKSVMQPENHICRTSAIPAPSKMG